MTLRTDERARVPFAVVGVLLLIGSAVYAAGVATRDPVDATSVTRRAVERATAGARIAVEAAATRAARRAVRHPVVDPADGSYGRALNESSPFRDALALRLYASARRALGGTEVSVADATATASLPPVQNATAVEAALDDVDVAPVDGGRSLSVTVQNVSVEVDRRGRTVASRRVDLTVVVEVPVFALHRRVDAFADSLHGDGPSSFQSRLAARLYAVAWARGYAQYGGAPIGNVLANRHVEVSTNSALLALQRAAIGNSDPAGRVALARAVGRVGLTDLVADTWGSPPSTVLRGVTGERVQSVERQVSPGRRLKTFNSTTPIAVGATADRVYARLTTRGTANISIDGLLDRLYSSRVRLRARTTTLDRSRTANETPPGDWTLTAVDVTTNVTVTPARRSRPPERRTGSRRLASFARRVVIQNRTVRRWRSGDRTARTVAVVSRTRRVSVALDARHAPTRYAPRRGIQAPRHAGPLGGDGLAGVRQAALQRLVRTRGGIGAVVTAAARNRSFTRSATVHVDRPSGLASWIRDDLATFRDRLRGVRVAVKRRRLIALSPGDRLAKALRNTRPALLDIPETYDSVAAKARVAARGAFLTALRTRLRRQGPGKAVQQALRSRYSVRTGVPNSVDRRRVEEPGRTPGTGTVRVRARPTYLPLAAVGADVLGAGSKRHVLVARNHNAFTLPYGETTAAVLSTVGETVPDRVPLRTAVQVLSSTVGPMDNQTLDRRRQQVRQALRNTVAGLRRRLNRTRLSSRAGLGPRRRARLLSRAFDEWDTAAAQARALHNGSFVDRFEALASRRAGKRSALLASRLRLAVRRLRRRPVGQVRADPVLEAARTARRVGRLQIERLAGDAVEAGTSRLRRRFLRGPLASVPAGLPVLPVPGSWYATVNVWNVTVAGRYPRLAVTMPTGTAHPAPNASYVRRAEPVRVDLDGDGRGELLGHNRPLSVHADVTVVVAVPAGGQGVGDLTGGRDERSAGWPPGPGKQTHKGGPQTTQRDQ
ncbi:MAG: hypothetical protein ABEJ08_04785 [Halobacteriaceae archaeon]